jgi:hypothetical protein
MNTKLKALAIGGAMLAGLSGTAAARDHVNFSLSFGVPAYTYAPAPVYYAPPAPVVYYSPPPAPVYYAPTRGGFYDRYGYWHPYGYRHNHRNWR